MIICSCIASVPTGHTGIVTTFGKVENYTLDAGIHFTAPWKSVVNMDNRVQKATLDLMAFSKDIQEVRVKYTLNYQINKDNAQELYRNVGKDYYDTVVTPIVAESVKAAASKYNAEGLVGDRNELTANIEVILSESLKQYDIEVVSTAVEDLDFTDAFTNAVEAKQVAQQDKLRAITEQERLTVEKQAEADRQVIDANAAAEVAKIQAQADLEVTKIQADAAEYAGLKEAMKNKAISEWLTDTLIQYYYIQQWDGKLPETYVGSEDVSTIVGMK
jgi:regulator of protease activity HflC (stomatin/prohibitin superfamily)